MEQIVLERYELAKNRISEIVREQQTEEPYAAFFAKIAGFLQNVIEVMEEKNPENAKDRNHRLYEDILPENYEVSYGNPAYCEKMLGDHGLQLCFLYAELRGMIPLAYEKRYWDITVEMELFLEIYGEFDHFAHPEPENIRDILYWYISDYSEQMIERRIQEAVDPSLDFAVNIIMNGDLSKTDYLYEYGEYVSENEIGISRFLAGLPEEEIEAMARTYTEGYRIGFINGRKDITKKKTVNIRYTIGFERMVKAAILQFAQMGLQPVIYRAAVHCVNKRQQNRIGYYGGIPNKQYEYDHRNDNALFLDDDFVTRKLRVMQTSYEKYKELAYVHGGPAVIETFGEIPFTPMAKPHIWELTDYQRMLQVRCDNESAQITNRYIIGEERSFTIIAYPVPEIGKDFADIFRETVKINTLDYKQYESIQQKIIKTLDLGTKVHIKGKAKNRTDLIVKLHELKHLDKETNFENCVADVNIPVGEVFTSPVLKGTNGVLHVSQVYLNELQYQNLEITFRDGMIERYSCSNFEEPHENQKFIQENILFHHETLPMGEFAIGTNTTAYMMAEKYHIQDKLPILIAEKMGPHFAVGDTCYSWAEDTKVYNPDGREIIARDNEVSIIRKSDPSKAYMGCHTDITIPYEELEYIRVICEDGSQIGIIENGRFVLEGTGELNEPFRR